MPGFTARLNAVLAAGARGQSLKQNSFAADSKLIQALEKRSEPISCSESHTLFGQGEVPRGLYILKSGEASLIKQSASGYIVMSFHAAAGSLLGLPGLVGNEPYTLSAIARKGSDVSFVTRNDFEDLVQEEPSLYPKVLQVLAAEVRAARRAVSET
jgi:CRP-like cAMP-binding protein